MTLETVGKIQQINDFRTGLEFVLKWEGGYVNHPKDPGGETKWGISKRAYPDLDIKNLSREQALEIYARDYWVKAGCDTLPFPLNVAAFDTAVNCGVSRTKSWLETSGNSLDTLLEKRASHYLFLASKNDKFQAFLRGWLNRMGDLKKLLSSSESSYEKLPKTTSK